MSEQTIIKAYNKSLSVKLLFVFVVLILLVLLIIISLLNGSAGIGLDELGHLFTGEATDFTKQVMFQIRLPRVVAAVLGGMALSVSGAVIQSLLRNPLASPFTLGISGASAFGAAFAIVVFGVGSSFVGAHNAWFGGNPYILTISAFFWCLLSIFLILAISKYKGAGPEIIILAGIIMSSLFGAGIAAMQYFADSVQLATIVFWTFGDLGRASWNNIIILLCVLVPVMVYFMLNTWNYKALQSGDEYARSMGVPVSRVRLIGMVLASLATATVVSFYGVIAFIGLVVPHIIRRIIGGDEQFLIPASAIFGAFFLLAADTLARSIFSPVILPVGILTSFMGAPLFLFLLIKGLNKTYWN